MSENEAKKRLQLVLERHTARCVVDLFKAHALRLAADPEPAEEVARSSFQFAGIIGLVGNLSGTLLLGGDATLVGRSHPLSATKPRLSMYEQLDWVGEAANQLTGRLKKRLAGHGLAFEFSPPVSITGERLRHVPSKGHTHRAAFHSSEAAVGVWIDVTLSDAAALRPELFVDDEVEAPEGTVTLF